MHSEPPRVCVPTALLKQHHQPAHKQQREVRMPAQNKWVLFGATVIVVAAACCAVAQADKPDDSAPSYLYFATESKSPLITPAYPLHRAVAYWDLAGVKAALGQVKGRTAADIANQAVNHNQGLGNFAYTPLAVAMESQNKCGAECRYYSDALVDIIFYLLCSGANPNIITRPQGFAPVVEAARANGNYPLVYALLASGADAASATKALQCVSCGYRNTADQPAALTSALALAFGADSSGNQKLLDFAYNMKDGKCVKPADGKSADTCYSTCKVLSEGLTAGEATELKAGRVSPALATRLDLKPWFVAEANAALAKAAASLKTCPAKKG